MSDEYVNVLMDKYVNVLTTMIVCKIAKGQEQLEERAELIQNLSQFQRACERARRLQHNVSERAKSVSMVSVSRQ